GIVTGNGTPPTLSGRYSSSTTANARASSIRTTRVRRAPQLTGSPANPPTRPPPRPPRHPRPGGRTPCPTPPPPPPPPARTPPSAERDRRVLARDPHLDLGGVRAHGREHGAAVATDIQDGAHLGVIHTRQGIRQREGQPRHRGQRCDPLSHR